MSSSSGGLVVLGDDRSTFRRLGFCVGDQALSCVECVFFVVEGERVVNRVTGLPEACSKYGYPVGSLRRECCGKVLRDGG